MPRIFGSNVRPDLPDKYGSAKYGAKIQHGQLQQEQKQQQNLLLRRKLQQQKQQQYAAASNVENGPTLDKSADASVGPDFERSADVLNDPRADPDYYDYYQDADEAALRRQQLLKQLRKRQGAAGTHIGNQRPPVAVGGPARPTSDYDDYGGMAGVGTSAIGASAAAGLIGASGGLIDRHGGHGTGGGYLYLGPYSIENRFSSVLHWIPYIGLPTCSASCVGLTLILAVPPSARFCLG